MQTKHLVKRGSRYIYRCRVPFDLLHCFPSPLIWKNLKTDKEKDARIAAAALEYSTQQLYMQLRTGMLPKKLQERLVMLYLNSYATALSADAKGQKFTGTDKDNTGVSEIFDQCAKGHLKWDQMQNGTAAQQGASRQEILKERVCTSDKLAQIFKSALPLKAISPFAAGAAARVAERLRTKQGIKLTPAECNTLGIELSNADKIIYEVQSAMLRGEWSPLEQLQQRVAKELETPYHDLKTVLEKYEDNYLSSKPNIKQGSKDDMAVECRVLLEIFGNISIADFNTMDSVTKLKKILLRYPLNKKQRYGDKSIHAILKEHQLYEVISLKTANTYIDRAKAVVKYAAKREMLKTANVYEDERFQINTAAEEDRPAYEAKDIKRLIEAICTMPLWIKNPPHPERFWLILIALFHGFRLGNIVALTKKDICQTDKGMWIFQLRVGKTAATIRPVAICDSLLLLGFLEWVEKLPRQKLFQDSSPSFSRWYNRDEVQKNGKPSQGFECKYVTTDKGKCLYSIRQ